MTQKPRAIRATEFVESLRKVQDKALDLFIPYVQAYLESGNFQCPLTESSYNVFGIKGSYNGQTTKVQTFEYVDGKKVIIYDDFRKYPDFDACISDYISKVKTMYLRAYENRGDYKEYYKGLLTWKDGKLVYPSWSTSTQYAEVLTKLYERLKVQGDLYEVVTGPRYPNE